MEAAAAVLVGPRRGRLAAAPHLVLAGVLLVAAAAIHLADGSSATGFLTTGRLADTDSWTRSLRVLDLWDGTARWFDASTPRLNAPDGLSLHWTRPLDLLILAPAAVLHLMAGLSRADSVLLAGAWVCPVLHWLCALAAVRAARPLWPGIGPLLAGLLVLGHPVALGYSGLGRSDHHTLVLLAGLPALGDAIRASLDPAADAGRDGGAAAWRAGAFAGAGIWVSPEALLFAAPILGGFGLAWVLQGAGPRGLPPAPSHAMALQGLRASLGLAAVCLLAVAVEHPPARWLGGDYDKVSVQHLGMGLLAAGLFATLARLPPALGCLARAGWGAALAGLALGVLLALRPDALRASLAGADAAAAAVFLPSVREMQPLDLFSRTGWQQLGPAVVALLALAVALPSWSRSGRLGPAILLGLTFLACLIATLRHLRFGIDLAAPAALLAAGLPAMVLEARQRLSPVLRLGGTLAALVGAAGIPVLVGLLPPGTATAGAEVPAAASARDCGVEAVVAALRRHAQEAGIGPGPAASPVLMANDINLGPELAWRVPPFRLVGAPYHRAGGAILDTQALFGAIEDAAARAVAERRAAWLLLLCPSPPGLGPGPGSLAEVLREGRGPSWLTPLPLAGLPPGVLVFTARP